MGDIRIDTRELEQFTQNLQALGRNTQPFLEACSQEIGIKLLARAKQNTPVQTGHLRNHWYARKGQRYQFTIYNPTEYAHYVEYGHRQTPGRYVPAIGKRLKRGWVNGRFMMSKAVDDLAPQVPAMLQQRLAQALGDIHRGR